MFFCGFLFSVFWGCFYFVLLTTSCPANQQGKAPGNVCPETKGNLLARSGPWPRWQSARGRKDNKLRCNPESAGALQTSQRKLKTNNQIIHSELCALWTSAEFWIRLEREGRKGNQRKKQTFHKGQRWSVNLSPNRLRGSSCPWGFAHAKTVLVFVQEYVLSFDRIYQ